MRNRNIFIFAVITFTILLAGGLFYYENSPVKKQIIEAITQEFSNTTGGRLSIGSISIGFFSATASDIEISIDFQSTHIEIDKIKLDFGITKFPDFSKLKAQDFIENITILNPKIKIIPYANLQDGENQETENLLCSQWSKLIIENTPFRFAKIKNCSIEIATKSNRQLANFFGLDGNLTRKNDEINIELSGTSRKFSKKNILINSRISKNIENQFLSLKFNSVPISSPLMQLDGNISFLINGDIDILFTDKYFPEAIIPNGTLSIKKLLVREKKQGIIFSGEMDILASEGKLNAANISATFGKNKIDGFAKMDLSRAGRANGNINFFIPIDDKNSLTIRNTIYLTDIINPKVFFKSKGIFYRNGKIDKFIGQGKFIDKKAVLDFLSVDIQDIAKGQFSGFIMPGVNYELEGKMKLDAKINNAISAKGDANLSLKGKKFSQFPTIAANVSGMKLVQNGKEILFPQLTLNQSGDTLNFITKNNNFSISGEIKLKDKFPFKANLNVTDSKGKEFFKFLGNDFPINGGSFSIQINGDTSVLNFNSKIFLKTENYGKISANAKGRVNKKQKNITISSAKWTIDKNSISFRAALNNSQNDWSIYLSSEKKDYINLNFVLDENMKKIKSGKITLNKFPLPFFNDFYKHGLVKNGNISGNISMNNEISDRIALDGNIKIQNAQIEDVKNIEAQISFAHFDSTTSIPQLTVKQDNNYLLRSRKLKKIGKKIYGEMAIDNLNLKTFLSFTNISDASGYVSARINADGEKIITKIAADSIFYQKIKLQNSKALLKIDDKEISLDKFESDILGLKTKLNFTALHQDGKIEEAKFSIDLKGDILAAAGSFKESPVGGKGEGGISFSGNISNGNLNIKSGRILIPSGQLTVYPFVRGHIDNVYADVKMIREDSIFIAVQGILDKKKIIIRNDYNVGELTPFNMANLNLGVLRVYTDKGGIPVFLPGFMENRKENAGWVETARKGNIPTFTIASHPDNFVTLAGTLLLRKAEITFPLLNDVEYPFDLDAFPYIYFDLDIRSVDRTVSYFYQLGQEKRRRGIRIIECTIDPSGMISLQGNDTEDNFKITGSLRSYNGYMYYGRMFDQNFEVGLDFQPELLLGGGYNNLPIIWGKAETYSDTNRLEKIRVKIKTRDEITNELRERGRFTNIVISLESDDPLYLANGYRSQDQTTADYYSNMSRDLLDLKHAGEMVSQLGDMYIGNYLLSYWGRRIARKIGLDMFRFETAIMKNSVDFLAERQLDENTTRNWNYLVFSNSSFIMGKYIFGSDIFLKYQAELMPREFTLVPEHKIGIEYQPLPYLWMDFNYGFFRELKTDDLIMNPEVRLQVRMPFSDLKNIFRKKQKSGESRSDEEITPAGSFPPS